MPILGNYLGKDDVRCSS